MARDDQAASFREKDLVEFAPPELGRPRRQRSFTQVRQVGTREAVPGALGYDLPSPRSATKVRVPQ